MTALVLAWLLRNRGLVVWGAVIAAVIGAAGGLYLAGRHAGGAAGTAKVAAAQAQAATAQAQTTVTSSAARAADRSAVRGARVTAQAEEAAHDVQSAPGAPDALPPDVLARWRAGVDGLRAPPAADADRADR